MPLWTLPPPDGFYLKAVGDKTGWVEGYASLFNREDSDSDVVAPGAFEATLEAWAKSGRTPPLLWQHDAAQPIGVWHVVKADAVGLFVRGQLFVNDVAKAAEAYALVKRGALSGLSIGYRPEQARRDARRGVRVLERVRLFEISLVTFPALETARVSAVKNRETACFSPDLSSAPVARALRQFTRWLAGATPVSAQRHPFNPGK